MRLFLEMAKVKINDAKAMKSLYCYAALMSPVDPVAR